MYILINSFKNLGQKLKYYERSEKGRTPVPGVVSEGFKDADAWPNRLGGKHGKEETSVPSGVNMSESARVSAQRLFRTQEEELHPRLH